MIPRKDKNRLIVDYDRLGTVSERELIHAVVDDLEYLKEEYGFKFFTGAKLLIWATNEHGDPLTIRSRTGSRMRWLNSTHYRPACLDYDL